MKKNIFAVLLSLVLIAGMFTGCGSSNDQKGNEESAKTVSERALVMRINLDAPAFDRHINSSYHAMMVQSFVCSYLINHQYDENGSYTTAITEDSLATSYTMDEDNQGVTFSLRDGVYFSDGTPMTAEDVVFSIQLSSDLSAYSFIDYDNVCVQNEQDIYIPFLTANANVLERISEIPIYSKEYYEECGAETDNSFFYGEGIMGTGAFVLESYESGHQIQLTTNEYYYGNKPEIKKIIIRIINETSVAFMELQTGGIDVMTDPDAISLASVEDGTFGDTIGIIESDSNSVEYLGYNCTSDSVCGDLRVRQAIAYAINLDDIVVGAYGQLGTRAEGIVSVFAEGTPQYTPENWPYEYNPEKAKEILAEAGYGDGLNVTLIFAGSESRKMAAELIANQLEAVGIHVTINQQDGSTVVATMANETKGWDLWIRAFENDPCPSKFFQDYVVTNTHCDETEKYDEYMGYVTDFSDEMEDDIRVGKWENFQKYYMEDCLYTYPLSQVVDYTLYNTELKDFDKLLYNNWDINDAYFE